MPLQEEFTKKASAAFADVHNRLLPIASKEATFHSALNVFAHMEDFSDEVFERVKKACRHFDIEDDVAPYAELFANEIEKSASEDVIPEGRFAINTALGGENFQLLPLNDAQDVTSSAFDLAKMASDNRVHILLMVPAAREVVKAAADFGVTGLPELIVRYGMERFPDSEQARDLIAGREQFCKDASISQIVANDYQEALSLIDEDPNAAMEKIATIDHTAGITPNYSKSAHVPTPFDIVFSGFLDSEVEKAAQENVLIRDIPIPLAELQKISPIAADYKLSKSASESFAKVRDCEDARDISLTVENWLEDDQRTLLRLAVEAAA